MTTKRATKSKRHSTGEAERRSLDGIVSLLRRRANREWKVIARERINAELEARSGDERAARARLDYLSGYIEALKDVKQTNAEGGRPRPFAAPKDSTI
jgi:hypothetical protein